MGAALRRASAAANKIPRNTGLPTKKTTGCP